ncbi:hypothetical protein EVA_15750 [gut metagenome]|uniref:Uncharacterized protein n=1 Tax=gut metagenome TaxID=749906 RepID=J9G9M9_9ZZZZ
MPNLGTSEIKSSHALSLFPNWEQVKEAGTVPLANLARSNVPNWHEVRSDNWQFQLLFNLGRSDSGINTNGVTVKFP